MRFIDRHSPVRIVKIVNPVNNSDFAIRHMRHIIIGPFRLAAFDPVEWMGQRYEIYIPVETQVYYGLHIVQLSINTAKTKEDKGSGGQMVSVLPLYSDDPSSYPAILKKRPFYFK